MKIKSLLIGSAAAVVVAPAAFAADIIIPEPEMVEYVRVCDAAGTGYFYIPGTETCLKISGFVRVQMDIEERWGDDETADVSPAAVYDGGEIDAFLFEDARWGWAWNTRGQVVFESWTDTDLGKLATKITYQGNSGAGGGDTNVKLDNATLSLGGLTMGYTDNAFDGGLIGEADSGGGAKVNLVSYEFMADSFSAKLSLDDDNAGDSAPTSVPDFLPNISGNVGFDLGSAELKFFGAYDFGTDEYALKARAGVDVGANGRAEILAYYTSGPTYVLNGTTNFGINEAEYGLAGTAYASGVPLWSEWSVQAAYGHDLTSALTLTGNIGYWANLGHIDNVANAGFPVIGASTTPLTDPIDADLWNLGLTLDYAITETFAFKGSVTHWMPLGEADTALDTKTTGFLRFEAKF